MKVDLSIFLYSNYWLLFVCYHAFYSSLFQSSLGFGGLGFWGIGISPSPPPQRD